MALELIRFLGAMVVIVLPGVWVARGFLPGENVLERVAVGCTLGLAMAVYVASGVSHVDLRGFYFLWGLVALVGGGIWLKSLRTKAPRGHVGEQFWVWLILAGVGVIQFGIALPHELPAGFLDPRFHSILAREIQLTHRAIDRWPFAGVALNYPTGSHVLVAVLSNISGLPVHTVFKDLIPLLDVLTSAQIYVLARRVSGEGLIGVYAAAIYGLWAWEGGIDYFRWGGLPNQLAMLLFVAMLSIWVGQGSRAATGAMAACCAGMILVHHHVMVVGGVILVAILFWQMLTHKQWKPLAIACAAAVVLDSFFVVPYLMKLASFRSTAILSAGEPVTEIASIPKVIGYAMTVFGVIGIVLCILKKIPRYSLVVIASSLLLVMFICGEYAIPAMIGHGEVGTFFTPSRFVSDLNYFLSIFAAGAILFFQRRLRVAAVMSVLVIVIAPLLDWRNWTDITNLYYPSPGFVAACRWIGMHTPASAIVDDSDSWTETWTTYLCWREGAVVPMPISEPVAEYHPASQWIPDVLAGKQAPPRPDLMIVAIEDARSYTGQPILWSDNSGQLVVQEWPITTSSSSEAGTPGRRLPGPGPGSGPTSR